jgi:hypothetical protein
MELDLKKLKVETENAQEPLLGHWMCIIVKNFKFTPNRVH